MLVTAIDTLRTRNETNPFVSSFMEERGLPVWNKASGYYKEGTPIFQVPVRHTDERKITGIVHIKIKDIQPLYSWTPRGAKVDGKTSQAIEAIIWGYERRVFGKTYTNGGLKILLKETSGRKPTNMISDAPTQCSKVCVPGDCHERPWNCDGGEGDSDGGFGGSGDGGGTGGGPHGGGGGGGGSGDSGGDDGSGNSFFGIIDITDLKNHPKANCVYGKLDATNTFRGVIAEFAGENTQFDLVFRVRDIQGHPNALGGATKTPNRNNEFTIIIDKSNLASNASLDVARTFIHEGIHAELRRKIASVDGIDNVDEMNFPGIFDYFDRHGEDWPHNQMAEHYRSVLVKGLKEFDDGKHSDEFYNDLAWRGLEGTRSWNENISTSDENRISKTYQNLLNESGSRKCK